MTKIFPAIDIINGSCVRLTEGKATALTDYQINPLEMAQEMEKAGACYIHIVDLDAALMKGDNKNVIREISKHTSLKIQTGGGIRTRNDIQALWDIGIEQCVLGSTAINKPSEVKEWLAEFGAEKIVIAADMIHEKIVTGGWKSMTSISWKDFIGDYSRAGAQKFLCTDVSKDGKLEGTAIPLYQKIRKKYPNGDFLASGGVSTLEEIQTLKEMEMYGIIIGKALYENSISLDQLFKQ